MRAAPLLAALAALAACGPAPARLSVPPAPLAERQAIAFASVEVLEVSVPAYAEGPEVFVRSGVALAEQRGAVWADDTPRALTLDLVRALSEISGALVAPEPWPFEEPAEARLDIRLSEAVADAGGAFVLAGQYFVASQDGTGRDRSREVRVEVPLVGEGPAAIAAARAEATARLAREIAAGGLR